jgi:RimJ/RimL family protein N-acetyltransferase
MENKNQSYFLKGEKVKLRAVAREDFNLITNWLNDEEITHYMVYGQRPTNEEQIAEWFQREHFKPENVVFMIVDLSNEKNIGFLGLYNIDPVAHKAEFRILIGEATFLGKGYGTEAIKLITFYGFDRLNLNRIYSGYVSENKKAEGAYENAGYSREGIFKDDVYRNGRYYDGVKIAISRKDFYDKFGNEFEKK